MYWLTRRYISSPVPQLIIHTMEKFSNFKNQQTLYECFMLCTQIISRWSTFVDLSSVLEFVEEWNFYADSAGPTQVISSGILRCVFQNFVTTFTEFKRLFRLSVDEDNFLMTLTALKRMGQVKKTKCQDLDDNLNMSRSQVVQFTDYDWLLFSYIRQDKKNKLNLELKSASIHTCYTYCQSLCE